MTREGWVILILIAIYFAWPALAFVTKLFFEGFFAGLGVRTSGVVKRLSREPKQSAPAFKVVRIRGHWRIQMEDGALLSWTFSTQEAAEQTAANLNRKVG